MNILAGGPSTGSALGNFSILLEASSADFVMCADHDDVWLPSKVRHTIEMLEAAERDVGATTPIFFFTDVIMVDRDGRTFSDSFWKFKKINPAIIDNLSQILVCAPMLGCASGMNRALVQAMLPIPQSVTGHDWWALLVARLFGVVRYSHERTMLYRQHGENQSRQKKASLWTYLRIGGGARFVRHGLSRRVTQADELLNVFDGRLRPEDRAIVQTFAGIQKQGFAARRLAIIRGNYLYPDAPRNIAMLVGM